MEETERNRWRRGDGGRSGRPLHAVEDTLTHDMAAEETPTDRKEIKTTCYHQFSNQKKKFHGNGFDRLFRRSG